MSDTDNTLKNQGTETPESQTEDITLFESTSKKPPKNSSRKRKVVTAAEDSTNETEENLQDNCISGDENVDESNPVDIATTIYIEPHDINEIETFVPKLSDNLTLELSNSKSLENTAVNDINSSKGKHKHEKEHNSKQKDKNKLEKHESKTETEQTNQIIEYKKHKKEPMEKKKSKKIHTLCKLTKKDFVKEHFSEYKELVINAEYICQKCGRVANDPKYLCKAKLISEIN